MDTFYIILQSKSLTLGDLLKAVQLVNDGWFKDSDFSLFDPKSHVCTSPLHDLPASPHPVCSFPE